jgi:hypothetical protein
MQGKAILAPSPQDASTLGFKRGEEKEKKTPPVTAFVFTGQSALRVGV